MASRQNDIPPSSEPTARAGSGRRAEVARRALGEGIERSRLLIDRYRTFLKRLHDPRAGASPVPARAVRPAGGSSRGPAQG